MQLLGTARLNGVSIYAPHVALATHDPASASLRVRKFLFAKQTLWNELVRALAQPEVVRRTAVEDVWTKTPRNQARMPER